MNRCSTAERRSPAHHLRSRLVCHRHQRQNRRIPRDFPHAASHVILVLPVADVGRSVVGFSFAEACGAFLGAADFFVIGGLPNRVCNDAKFHAAKKSTQSQCFSEFPSGNATRRTIYSSQPFASEPSLCESRPLESFKSSGAKWQLCQCAPNARACATPPVRTAALANQQTASVATRHAASRVGTC